MKIWIIGLLIVGIFSGCVKPQPSSWTENEILAEPHALPDNKPIKKEWVNYCATPQNNNISIYKDGKFILNISQETPCGWVFL